MCVDAGAVAPRGANRTDRRDESPLPRTQPSLHRPHERDARAYIERLCALAIRAVAAALRSATSCGVAVLT